jgi:hypothetical protein
MNELQKEAENYWNLCDGRLLIRGFQPLHCEQEINFITSCALDDIKVMVWSSYLCSGLDNIKSTENRFDIKVDYLKKIPENVRPLWMDWLATSQDEEYFVGQEPMGAPTVMRDDRNITLLLHYARIHGILTERIIPSSPFTPAILVLTNRLGAYLKQRLGKIRFALEEIKSL